MKLKEIIIKNVYKTKVNDDKYRLNSDILIGTKEVTLWYEVDDHHEKYLVDDRADAFVVVFINYALLYRYDIVSEVSISEKLYYNLKQHYIPGLYNNNKEFHKINLVSPTISETLENEGKVGTGMSGGVDSFATYILNTSKDLPEKYRINYLAFFNVGAVQSSNYPKYPIQDVFDYEREDIIKDSLKINEQRYNKSKEVANTLGLPIVRIESNILEIQKVRHMLLHTQRAASAVLALQKLFSRYYFASAISLNNFRIEKNDPAYYDIFALNMFSTENIEFVSGDLAYNRVLKTELIAKEEVVQNHLNVCRHEDENCGKCGKCIRTLTTLDFSNNLKSFKNVFDIESYLKDREKHLAYITIKSRKDLFSKEILEYGKNNNAKYKNFKYYCHLCAYIMKFGIRKILITIKKIF